MRLSDETLRLYAVTDRAWTGESTLHEQVEAALRGGATCVQLREKEMAFEDFLEEAIDLKRLCSRYHVPLLINDNVEIAVKSRADGVHLGQEDASPRDVRRLCGSNFLIGVTAKTVGQARRAELDGADYLGSGAVFGSSTKTNARPLSREALHEIACSVSIPVVAIGGICRDNLPTLSGLGIAGVAVVSGIFAAADIEAECRLLRRMTDELFTK